MKDLEVSQGDDAKFDVRVDGADVEVDWYRDDELLEDAGRIIIEDPHPESDDNLYSLTIENCGPKDSGMNYLVIQVISCSCFSQSTLRKGCPNRNPFCYIPSIISFVILCETS